MIKPVESATPRKGLRWDPKRGKHIGYHVDFTAGRRHRGTFETRKQAEEFVEKVRMAFKLRKAGVREFVDPPTVRELLDARLKRIRNHAEKIRSIRIFEAFCKIAGPKTKVTEVRKADFTKFKNVRLEQGVKPETVNRELNPLSKAFSDAADMFPDALEDFDPPKVARPKFKRKRRERIVTEEEKDSILSHLYAPQRPDERDGAFKNRIRIGRMFHIAYLLGMAYKEVANVKKENYDGTGLSFIRAKTGNQVTFEYLPDEAHEVLRAAIAASDTEFIFTHTGSTPKNFYPELKRAIEAAGLVYGRDSGVTFHTARHAFVSKAMQVADLKTVGSLTGHSDDVMVLHYTHATPETRRRAFEAMYGKRDLRSIYEKVWNREISFEEFEEALK